eukprot:Nk52_evm71s208 gene=Nk52_evmTU71s208
MDMDYMVGAAGVHGEDHEGAGNITWAGIMLASSLILINGALSLYLQLGLEKKLLVSALRLVVQLSALGLILKPVFEEKNPIYVIAFQSVLVLLAAYETTYNKTKLQYTGMFLNVLVSILLSAGLNMVIGMSFIITGSPWYEPRRLIPVLGMLLGNSMTAMALGLNSILRDFTENRDKIELSLAYGATRFEACRPILTEAIRTGLLPVLNMMSVMGLIAIPGMMTGQILGGTPPMVAARYQQAIMFLISSCAALACVGCCVMTVTLMFDGKHRLRGGRISRKQSWLSIAFRGVSSAVFYLFTCACCRAGVVPEEEVQPRGKQQQVGNKGTGPSETTKLLPK